MRPQLNPLILGPGAPWSFPGSSLDLQFTTGRAAVNRQKASISSLLTTTRASTGYASTSTGLLVLFPSNTPRITDRGLLVEQAATNVILQSNTLSTTWSAQGLNGASNPTVTANSGISPDGTNNAWAFTVPALTGTQVGRIIQASASASGSNTFTASVWLWVASGTAQITFQIDDSSNGNLAVGSVITVTATTTPTRYTTTGTFAGTPGNARFNLSTGSGSGFAGSGGYTLLMFGAQLESGSIATSYIPTTTVSVTRAADNITTARTGTATGGVVLSAITPANVGANRNIWSWSDGGGNNRISIFQNTSGNILLFVSAGGVTQVNGLNGGNVALNTSFKVAVRWRASSWGISVNGAAEVTQASGSVPNGLVSIQQGDWTGGGPWNSYIQRETIFPNDSINTVTLST